jgi:hypothetical protein
MEGRERTAPWLLVLVLTLILALILALILRLTLILLRRLSLLLPIPRLSLPMYLCANLLRPEPTPGRIPSAMVPCPSARWTVLSWKVTSVALPVGVFTGLLGVVSVFCAISGGLRMIDGKETYTFWYRRVLVFGPAASRSEAPVTVDTELFDVVRSSGWDIVVRGYEKEMVLVVLTCDAVMNDVVMMRSVMPLLRD